MRIQKKDKKKTATTLVILVIIILASLFFVAYKMISHNDSDQKKNDTSSNTTRDTNDVDYTGPSSDDIANSQDAKKRGEQTKIDGMTDTPSDGGISKKIANIGISYADINNDQLEVRAFINDVIEGSGECILIATSSNNRQTISTPAFIDVSSTICEPLYIPKSKLSKGTWTISVSYSSPSYSGTSNQVKVEVN